MVASLRAVPTTLLRSDSPADNADLGFRHGVTCRLSASEGLACVAKHGVDIGKALEAINGSSGRR